MLQKPKPPLEHEEQTALIDWVRCREGQYPLLKRLFAIPNGGHRHIHIAMNLKREGVRAGVPDLFLPVPRVIDALDPESGEIHGLFIEMKRKGEYPSSEQADWHSFLRGQGYRLALCYTWFKAWNEIVNYLGLPESERLQEKRR